MENEYRVVVFDADDDSVDPETSPIACRGMHVQFGLCRRFVQVPKLNCDAFLTTNTQITIGSNVSEPKEAKRADYGIAARAGNDSQAWWPISGFEHALTDHVRQSRRRGAILDVNKVSGDGVREGIVS